MSRSRAETIVARSARTAMADGNPVGDAGTSPLLRELLAGLERLISEVLTETYPQWDHESLDGVLPVWVRRTGVGSLEVLGVAMLLSDQTVVPVFVRLRPAMENDRVAEIEVFLGWPGADGMIRTPNNGRDIVSRPLLDLQVSPDELEWCFHARRPERKTGNSE